MVIDLSVNFNKSKMYHVSKSPEECAKGIEIMNFQAGKIPFKYLDDCVGLDYRAGKFWSPLIDSVKEKFQGWKCSSLNKAVRMVLIRSTLNSLPNYWFILHLIPKSIVSKLDSIRRQFLGEKF